MDWWKCASKLCRDGVNSIASQREEQHPHSTPGGHHSLEVTNSILALSTADKLSKQHISESLGSLQIEACLFAAM